MRESQFLSLLSPSLLFPLHPMTSSTTISVPAKPAPFTLDISTTALIVIDMQRDFLKGGGFGEALGNDVTKLQRAIGPCKRVLETVRQLKEQQQQQQQGEEINDEKGGGVLVLHTREGHRPQGVCVYESKQKHARGAIGRESMNNGRILIRGEKGHDIIEELCPTEDEAVIDKPGKGSFYATDLELILRANHIKTLIVCGVTTEVCVHTTVREANDRGFQCLVVEDACSSYIDEFHEAAIKMVWAQGGIFGSVTTSTELVQSLTGGG